MIEQPAQNQSGCSAALVQTPDTLHIDLPHVDPKEVCFTINKCLIQITTKHWELMTNGLVSCVTTAGLANSCMDIIQIFAEAIVDVVMPQVYRYMRNYGTFSPSVLGLTEDRIHIYLGDSIEQALANALKIKVQNFVATKEFSKSLLRHISKTVNSVLALFTQTPALESRLPVIFVSGCVTSIGELTDMVRQFATILTGAFEAQQQAQKMTEDQRSQTALYEPGREVEPPIFNLNSKSDLKKLVKTYIIRMLKVLKNTQMSNCEMSPSNHGDVCIRVGSKTHILTVEDRKLDRQESAMSSYCGLDSIPGAVPDTNDTESHSDRCPFSSITVISKTEDHSSRLSPIEMESIKNIADELVQDFLEVDLQGAVQTDSWLEVVKLRELTDRTFNVVMTGRDYQIPLVPAGTRICDTVIYRNLRRKGVTDSGIVAHALYLRTAEVVTRCAVQVLLWSELHSEKSYYPSPLAFEQLSVDPDFVFVGHAAGDHLEVVPVTPSPNIAPVLSQENIVTYEVIPEPLELMQAQLLGGNFHASLLTLLVREMLIVIGIENSEMISEVVKKVIQQIQDVDPMLYNHFYDTLMGRSFKDIYQAGISDLQLEFGSVDELKEVIKSGDPTFEEAIVRALRTQLGMPTYPEPHRNTAKKTTCGFFKKLKKLCSKKKKPGKTTPVISLTRDQDRSQLQGQLKESSH
ncbi:uncharacterized protein LOC114573663 [Perca flavescens]|uniref:uncharacterized protein LOC114573663 n=1 Tax=Perca flavescens TaxID=8167 RepID=UPI00106E8BC8|nr:uncharacterized protein LOC114573663 [Perca flavescens]